MRISQSLIKEVLKQDHCPKQIYYSFVEGKELINDPSNNMISGRYFESELLGSCRNGEKEEAKLKSNGEKYQFYVDVDKNVIFAKDIFQKLGIDIEKGESQVDLKSDLLSAAIDHVNNDLIDPTKKANYDLKWTATAEDDRWNGWGDPETKEDAKIQATHYTLVAYELFNEWRPFYFLVFGKTNWVKIIQFKITEEALNVHKDRISHTANVIRNYAENNYKGNGSFNKCQSCPFHSFCEDRKVNPEIETIII